MSSAVASSAPVEVGDVLPDLTVDVTATFVISSALASRDFEPVHHDRRAVEEAGMRDVFLNILTTNGLVVRLVTDWAGPDAVVRRSTIRLGVPCYAGDTLALTGEVAAVDGRHVTVAVRGTCSLGDHVTGSVEVDLPEAAG